MSAIALILVGLIVLALIVYGLSYLSPPLDAGIVRIIQAAVIILGAVWVAGRVGLF